MPDVKRFLLAVYYSLPVQLFVRHIRHYKLLLLFWLVLLALITGGLGSALGGAYLFLEPEYMGRENFWSYFIVGSAMGGFLFAYMITLFINESYRFHFLGKYKSPFYVLSLNNMIVPGGFLLVYISYFLKYQIAHQGAFNWIVIENIGGVILGILLMFLLSASYFFAQHTVFQWLGQRLEKRFVKVDAWRRRFVILSKAKTALKSQKRADHYLVGLFKIERVGEMPNTRLRELVYSLSQHHGKLLILQVMVFLMIAMLGTFEHISWFQIPAGASFLIVFSLLMMIVGAVSFWFRRLGATLVVSSLVLLGACNHLDLLEEQNPAYGLKYDVPLAAYEKDALDQLANEEIYQADRAETIAYLENWKANYQAKYGPNTKPRAVFLTASGGGLRSAYWTFRVLQRLDSLSNGQLADETRLMTGASGGMIGLSYYRELQWLRQQKAINLQDKGYGENISKDLLNRLFFTQYADMLLPNEKVKLDGQTYNRDGGFSFDEQLAENLPEIAGRRLGDYAFAEAKGQIPPVILTPTVLNQGRKLYIASNSVSYLTRPNRITDSYLSKASGIEFKRMFAAHDADSLLLTTALRMNATFPYVLPIVELPSEPSMQVMDAGAIDNYGTQTAVKYLFEFREWFAENTSGVYFIQIRDNYREDPIRFGEKANMFSSMMRPLGGGLYSMAEARDMANDYLLEFMQEWYEGPMEVVPIEYPRESFEQPASLSWHLTQREKNSIRQSLNNHQNMAIFEMMAGLYQNQHASSGRLAER
ncbi:MAG: patatin-like phospholipase family protein [Bacteroidota bacterium]